MPEIKKPRRGSLAYYPRKRARRIYPTVTVYPKAEKVKPLVFAGYKVGCTHAVVLDTRKSSPTFGKEIVVPVTILDCPPLKVVGIRVYKNTEKGLKALTEVWCKELPKGLERKVRVKSNEEKIKELEGKSFDDVRLIVCTQPLLSGIRKKKPEIFEVGISGKDAREKLEFAKSMLGKEVNHKDVFREGELVDVIAVTKGKGTAGPVERFGIKVQPRHAKQKRRHVGSLGQERPGKVRPTVPMAGQLGFARRTELNKRVLKLGEGGISPKGGFKRYGIVKSNYIVIEGSVPGSKKRLVLMRSAIRPKSISIPELRKLVV
jgi:large subunit ribosomal protein L3